MSQMFLTTRQDITIRLAVAHDNRVYLLNMDDIYKDTPMPLCLNSIEAWKQLLNCDKVEIINKRCPKCNKLMRYNGSYPSQKHHRDGFKDSPATYWYCDTDTETCYKIKERGHYNLINKEIER